MTTSVVGKMRGTPVSAIFAGDVQRTTYTVTYIIESDAPSTDDEKIVLATTGLPSLTDTWAGATSTDTTVSVVSMQARQDPIRSATWYVEVEYDSDLDIGQGGQGGGSSSDPTDLSPEIEYDYEVREFEAYWDAFDKPLETSAKEPFPDTSIILQRPVTVVTYSRWETSHPAVVQQTYMNRCNATPFSGAGTYEVLMTGIRSRLRPIIGTRLWWTTYRMVWDPNGWELRKPDIGTYSGSPTAKIYKFVSGVRVDVPMDGAGAESLTGVAFVHNFHPYGVADFNALNF